MYRRTRPTDPADRRLRTTHVSKEDPCRQAIKERFTGNLSAETRVHSGQKRQLDPCDQRNSKDGGNGQKIRYSQSQFKGQKR